MLLVSVLLAITWSPANVYGFMNNLSKLRPNRNVMYFVIIMAHCYLCINPFIYATKFDRFLDSSAEMVKSQSQECGLDVGLSHDGLVPVSVFGICSRSRSLSQGLVSLPRTHLHTNRECY